ncbi:hypothetical protein [Leisingera daeponensis]|uniref:hypothetical protein n=1 Tax=Leisingera daeponensis TaxID=405746 RepID=UPI001C9859CC|nr:hypothetical protein [Leisingera daeponensis]MBY6055357.1 hypothetical protein [Leisingera daeponensis]
MCERGADGLIEKVREILDGIDRTESEADGWWETSVGADFGGGKLAELERAIRAEFEKVQ